MKKTTTATPPAPGDQDPDQQDPEKLDPTPDELEALDHLEEFLARFEGQDFKVRIQKWDAEDTDWVYVDRVRLAGFDPFAALKKHGTGRYRLTLLDPKGKFVPKGSQELRIKFTEEIAAEPAVPAAAAAPDPLDSPVVKLVLAMLQQNATMSAEIMKAMVQARPAEPAKDQKMLELLLQHAIDSKDSKAGGLKDSLELLVTFRELLDNREPSSEGSLLGEIREGLKLIKEMGHRGPAAPRPALPQPQPATVINAGQVLDPSKDKPMNAFVAIMKYLPQLEDAAKRTEPVEPWAQFVLDRLELEIIPLLVKEYAARGVAMTEDQVYQILLSKAKDPAQVGQIFQLMPRLDNVRPWIQAVIEEAVKIADEPDQGAGAAA